VIKLYMISVVVPALNEQDYIARCLNSLAQQDYPGRFEIIVVDNGSIDSTAAIAGSLGARVIHQPRKGIARARHSGFLAARGQIIASTDADTTVPGDWLSRINRLFRQNPGAVAVAGHFLLSDGPASVRWWIRVSRRLMPYILKFIPWLWNFSDVNFAIRADAFASVGGFNTDIPLGEDIDLCRRLRQKGRVIFEPSLLVQTSGRAFSNDRLGLKHLFHYLKLLRQS